MSPQFLQWICTLNIHLEILHIIDLTSNKIKTNSPHFLGNLVCASYIL